MLDRARHTIEIDDYSKQEMHLACYSAEIKSLLKITSDENSNKNDGGDDEGDSLNYDVVFKEGSLEW